MKTVHNREARSKYEFLETVDAGIVLSGAEVKSVKKGQINLKGSYVSIDDNSEVWIKNLHISPYQQSNQEGYDPEQPRKLLLTKQQIDRFRGKTNEEGLTIVPQKVYSMQGLVKVTIALARGLKKHDKRQRIKDRDTRRKVNRALKQGY